MSITRGSSSKAGQPLFMIYSPELLTTQQEYLLALESRAQLRESQIADVGSMPTESWPRLASG